MAPNPGAALWASSAAGAARAGPQGMHYGGAWDQPGSTGSAGFAGTTAAGAPSAGRRLPAEEERAPPGACSAKPRSRAQQHKK